MEGAKALSGYVVLANFVFWPVMQLGVAWMALRLPERWFQQRDEGRTHRAELAMYRRVLFVKLWKRLLPDGASWLGGGFSKAKLQSHQREYLERFVAETRRGEVTHIVALVCSLASFWWNPRSVWPVLVAVAVVLNMPCIVVQRYNRFVLQPRLSAMSRDGRS